MSWHYVVKVRGESTYLASFRSADDATFVSDRRNALHFALDQEREVRTLARALALPCDVISVTGARHA